MTIDGDADIEGLKLAGRVVASCLAYMQQAARPGMTTAELDALGAAFLKRHGAVSAPVLTYGFPGHTCISVNEHVAHGVPNDTVLAVGDLVNIDVSAQLDGYIGDTGGSFVLARDANEGQRAILDAARRARDEAIDEVRDGRLLRVVGQAVERVARETGFRIIRNLGSHGVGRSLHEEPSFIAGYDDHTDVRRFHAGMVVTVEPFLTDGRAIVRELSDGWTLANRRGSMSAQFEHTIVVGTDGPEILTVTGDGASAAGTLADLEAAERQRGSRTTTGISREVLR